MKELPRVISWCDPQIPESNHSEIISDTEHCIIPFASHVEPKGGRHDGLAPMVCCTLWLPPQSGPEFFILHAAERSTLTVLAQGIDHAVCKIVGEHGKVPIECITESDGVWTLIRTVEESYKHGRTDIDGLPILMALAVLKEMVGLNERRPKNRLEKRLVQQAKAEAKTRRTDVLADFRAEPENFKVSGIKWIGYEQTEDLRCDAESEQSPHRKTEGARNAAATCNAARSILGVPPRNG